MMRLFKKIIETKFFKKIKLFFSVFKRIDEIIEEQKRLKKQIINIEEKYSKKINYLKNKIIKSKKDINFLGFQLKQCIEKKEMTSNSIREHLLEIVNRPSLN